MAVTRVSGSDRCRVGVASAWGYRTPIRQGKANAQGLSLDLLWDA